MSLHVQLSTEAEIALRKQQRSSSILSGIIACLVVALLGVILALFALPVFVKENPMIVSYVPDIPPKEEAEVKKKVTKIQPKPSAPSSSMSKVIAANATSPTFLTVPDIAVDQPSMSFGDDLGFALSMGSGGFESGSGASFFGQKVKAKRIAYVIDFSESMTKNNRVGLMKTELTKSVAGLSSGMSYQLVFFSGPAWVAGDILKHNGKTASVISGQSQFLWKTKNSFFDWYPLDEKPQVATWQTVSSSTIEKSIEHIQKTQLSEGTVWGPALTMALNMEPPPQVIYFMTDGVAGSKSMEIAEEMAQLATKKNVVINAVALMEPKAKNAMILLAERTGGQATLVNAKGEIEPLVLMKK